MAHDNHLIPWLHHGVTTKHFEMILYMVYTVSKYHRIIMWYISILWFCFHSLILSIIVHFNSIWYCVYYSTVMVFSLFFLCLFLLFSAVSRGLSLITSHLLLSPLSPPVIPPSVSIPLFSPHPSAPPVNGLFQVQLTPATAMDRPISATRLHDYFYSVPQVPWWITLIKWYLHIFSCTSIFLKPHPKCMCLFVIKVSHISHYFLAWNIMSSQSAWLHCNKIHIKQDTGLIRHYSSERCETGNIWWENPLSTHQSLLMLNIYAHTRRSWTCSRHTRGCNYQGGKSCEPWKKSEPQTIW